MTHRPCSEQGPLRRMCSDCKGLKINAIAYEGAVAIECEHGRDVCYECDKCKTCSGSGTVEAPLPWEPCERCGGDGLDYRYPARRKTATLCQPCSGRGRTLAWPRDVVRLAAAVRGGCEVRCSLCIGGITKFGYTGECSACMGTGVYKTVGDQSATVGLRDSLLEAGYHELAEHFSQERHDASCWGLKLLLGGN